MIERKPLIIGNLKARIPVIQGGMGVGISLSGLAGSVAACGGVGLISTAQIGWREPDFEKNPLKANFRAIHKEVAKAREIAQGEGILGVNIMVATNRYEEYVRESVEAGVDLIVSGAGLPVDLPKYVEGSKTKIAPIVSSVKSLKVICKMWDRKYHRVPDLVVIEGPRAGGHLGFRWEELNHPENLDYDGVIRDILAEIKGYEEKYNKKVPVAVAGGIYDREDMDHALELGADAVQVGTRFVTTEECDASDAYKAAYLKAGKEDICLVKSPVGMPGRALRNAFIQRASNSPVPVRHCYRCISTCKPSEIPYCITKALTQAVEGNVEEGLIFCGDNVWRCEKIEKVFDIMSEFS